MVSDYFRHAGYHVDPESRLVSTASGHNKYSITGKENPIKVASQFGLKPQLLTNLSDPLFSHQVIKGQDGFCSAFSNILSETPADNVSEVVNRCLETLDSMDSVFVSNKSAFLISKTADSETPEESQALFKFSSILLTRINFGEDDPSKVAV